MRMGMKSSSRKWEFSRKKLTKLLRQLPKVDSSSGYYFKIINYDSLCKSDSHCLRVWMFASVTVEGKETFHESSLKCYSYSN